MILFKTTFAWKLSGKLSLFLLASFSVSGIILNWDWSKRSAPFLLEGKSRRCN